MAPISVRTALAKVTRDNQQVTLTASRDLRFLLQEVLEKQMTSRGYMIGPSGAVDLQIIVNNLYADVSRGNVRYNIATKADIAIIATAKNGNKMNKTTVRAIPLKAHSGLNKISLTRLTAC